MANQTDLTPVLAAMVEDDLPSRREAVDAILHAIEAAALYPDGVTASSVREEIPEQIRDQYPHQIGATVGHLVRSGILTPTGWYAHSGNDRSGNRRRPVPIYHCDLAALREHINDRSS